MEGKSLSKGFGEEFLEPFGFLDVEAKPKYNENDVFVFFFNKNLSEVYGSRQGCSKGGLRYPPDKLLSAG